MRHRTCAHRHPPGSPHRAARRCRAGLRSWTMGSGFDLELFANQYYRCLMKVFAVVCSQDHLVVLRLEVSEVVFRTSLPNLEQLIIPFRVLLEYLEVKSHAPAKYR